jgi:hypothetical protein
MVFWLGIFVGGVFAWYAVKMGFYDMWAMLFNIVISIYLAVFLGPVIVDLIPAAGGGRYSNILAMMGTAIAVFLILHCISYTFITGLFTVSFPRLFNSLGAGFLGFLGGFLVWSFVALLIYMSPISQNSFVKEIGFGSEFRETNVSYMSWWCNLVHKAVASEDAGITSEKAIGELLESAEMNGREKTSEGPEPNEPTGTNVKDM